MRSTQLMQSIPDPGNAASSRAAVLCRLPLAALLLAAGCSSQIAWTTFYDNSGATFSYDATSVRKNDDTNRARVQILEDHMFAVIDRTGQEYMSARQSWEFACGSQSLTRLSVDRFTGHNGAGRNLSIDNDVNRNADPQTLATQHYTEDDKPAPRAENIRPGSAEDTMFKIVCSR